MGLTEIDLSNHKKLKGIYLKENKLRSLTLQGKDVAGLNIHGNAIKTLDLSKLEFNSSSSYFDDMQRIPWKADEKHQVDMKQIVGAENLNRVIIDE